jgi:hypothetical protein
MRELVLAPGEGLSVGNAVGGLFTFKVTCDREHRAVTASETFITALRMPSRTAIRSL